jgi:hypothetical protein
MHFVRKRQVVHAWWVEVIASVEAEKFHHHFTRLHCKLSDAFYISEGLRKSGARFIFHAARFSLHTYVVWCCVGTMYSLNSSMPACFYKHVSCTRTWKLPHFHVPAVPVLFVYAMVSGDRNILKCFYREPQYRLCYGHVPKHGEVSKWPFVLGRHESRWWICAVKYGQIRRALRF